MWLMQTIRISGSRKIKKTTKIEWFQLFWIFKFYFSRLQKCLFKIYYEWKIKRSKKCIELDTTKYLYRKFGLLPSAEWMRGWNKSEKTWINCKMRREPIPISFLCGFSLLLLLENGSCLLGKLAGNGFTNVADKTLNAAQYKSWSAYGRWKSGFIICANKLHHMT